MTDVQSIIDRAKNSKYFEVTVNLEEPLQFRGGRVPFDIKSDGATATFNVLAETHEEADALVREWLNGNKEEDA